MMVGALTRWRLSPRVCCVLAAAAAWVLGCSDGDSGSSSGGGADASAASADGDDDEATDDTGSSSGSGNGSTAPGPGAGAVATDEMLIEQSEIPESSSVFGVLTEECEGISEIPDQQRAPVDIVFVIDNSSSMGGEIEQVQERINEDFIRAIASSEVDYRVIMASRYGDVNVSVGESDHPICIRAPLGGHDCDDPENQPLAHNPPRFYHYSADIRSREPWCALLEGWDEEDELTETGDPDRDWESVAPIGWRHFLREEAFKHFVVISDDDAECSTRGYDFDDRGSVNGGQDAAIGFDTALLALSPRQFGSNVERNYKWHSIIGLSEYTGPLEPWPPTEPIQTDTCTPGSEGPATGFQALSVLTEGLRYPSCNNENFDAVFRALAETVVTGSLSCEWAIPDNDEFSADAVNFRWIDGNDVPQIIVNVPDEDECDEGGWYFDDNDDPKTVIACPSTCDLLQSDPNGRVELLFGCDIVTQRPEAR